MGKLLKWIQYRRKELLLSFLSFVFAIGVIGVILEIYFRYDFAKNHEALWEEKKHKKRCFQAAQIPELIYAFRPGECGTNSHGFMDRERSYKKPANTFRIALIGDSVVEGIGLGKKDKSFGTLLEEMLNEREGKKNIEIINLGVRGYSTIQELAILEEVAPRYEPDLVLWNYVLNDAVNPVFSNVDDQSASFFYQPRSYFLYFLQKRIIGMWGKMMKAECGEEFHHYLHCKNWRSVEAHITELGQIQSETIPIHFIIHPVFQPEGFVDYKFKDLHDQIGALASAQDLNVIDLISIYEKESLWDVSVNDSIRILQEEWFDPWHPSAYGHLIIAAHLQQQLAPDLP